MTDRILSMISLATKAGRTKSGQFETEQAVKSQRAYLVIVSTDASENTKKHFSDMCSFRKVPYRIYSDSDSLGHAMGQEFRKVAAICDSGFAKSLIQKIDQAAVSGKEDKEWQK